MTPAMMITFIIVPIPGFCFKKTQSNKTPTLIRKVEVPMVIPVILVIPSANTDQGEFPVVDRSNNPSPSPNIVKPKQSKRKVDNFGLKLSGFSELQLLCGIFLILKILNIKINIILFNFELHKYRT